MAERILEVLASTPVIVMAFLLAWFLVYRTDVKQKQEADAFFASLMKAVALAVVVYLLIRFLNWAQQA